MGLQFRAKSGPLSGHIFTVQPGLTIGRRDATINLNDSRVSSLHARVIERDGKLLLEDVQSKNGIRDARGENLTFVSLEPGAFFAIGDSQFLVEGTLEPAQAESRVSDPEQAVLVKKKPKKKKREIYWNDALAEFLDANSKKFKDQPRPLLPLNPALVLEFVRGAQVHSRWILGFGPRQVGPQCLDLPIWEPGAPAICFEVFPSPDGLIFKTQHPTIVRLNGQEVDNEVLRMGDTIAIKDTLIEVDFTE